jgi:hypothetical protein
MTFATWASGLAILSCCTLRCERLEKLPVALTPFAWPSNRRSLQKAL